MTTPSSAAALHYAHPLYDLRRKMKILGIALLLILQASFSFALSPVPSVYDEQPWVAFPDSQFEDATVQSVIVSTVESYNAFRKYGREENKAVSVIFDTEQSDLLEKKITIGFSGLTLMRRLDILEAKYGLKWHVDGWTITAGKEMEHPLPKEVELSFEGTRDSTALIKMVNISDEAVYLGEGFSGTSNFMLVDGFWKQSFQKIDTGREIEPKEHVLARFTLEENAEEYICQEITNGRRYMLYFNTKRVDPDAGINSVTSLRDSTP